ncbi:MAG: DUF4910 domain-containing protein, partial [Pseudomonadota bacterium]
MSTGRTEAYVGEEIFALMESLYPLHRSITGEGNRQTLKMLSEIVPLEIVEIPSGTSVFDWTVPQEWRIADAYIALPNGERLLDLAASNLHVVSYSTAVSQTLSWEELKEHLYFDRKNPDWIPYRTDYYGDNWGFCLSYKQYQAIESAGHDKFRAEIVAEKFDGSLTCGEIFLPGSSPREVLISCHICHPSLANDNLSGIATAIHLARDLAASDNNLSYRFVFVPATIGAIAWLATRQEVLSNIQDGLVLTLLGDRGRSTYKRSRKGSADIDQAVAHVLEYSGADFEIRRFEPWGYDERQYCSPGVNLNVGCFMRTPNGEYQEYHTSGDNMDIIDSDSLQDSWEKCHAIFRILENNGCYENLLPYGEPRLGQHDLYSAFAHNES